MTMRKPFTRIALSTAVAISSLPVVEERERFHIEQRQYQEPSKETHENPGITATVIRGTVGSLFDYGRWNHEAMAQKEETSEGRAKRKPQHG